MASVAEQSSDFVGQDGLQRRSLVRVPAASGRHRSVLVLPGLALPHKSTPVEGYVSSIAQALADGGVAVVRWVPRWSGDGATPLQKLDWHGEIDDAVAALRWLQEQSWADPAEVYLLGVSLGGVAAPLVAQRSGAVAGIASWAATARPWVKYAVATLRHQLLWRGVPPQIVAQAVAASEWWHQHLRDTDLDAAELLAANPEIAGVEVTRDGCMGRPTAFWRQLCRHDSVAAHRGLSCRICTVRGSADFAAHPADQQSIVDAAKQAGLAVDSITLEGLDHLLRPAASPQEAFCGRVHGGPQYARLAEAVLRWMGGGQ